jgi:hypothetical protein
MCYAKLSFIEIGLLVLEKNIFFNVNLYKENMVFPIVAPSDPWGPWFVQT